MPTYIVAAPAGVSETDADRLAAFLRAQGVGVRSVVALRHGDDLIYVIDADRTPVPVLERYLPTNML